MSSCFVTGTDTGVGKTRVATALVRDLVAAGRRVAVMKPVASGARRTPEGLRNEDAEALQQAANVRAPYARVNPYCFEPPIAPHLAAQEAGISIHVKRIAGEFAALASLADDVVVEGAGGWLVPLSTSETMADIALALRTEVVLVVGLRLGCLNHAFLTWEAIARSGVPVRGWAANILDPDMPRIPENLATLERRMGAPMKVVPYDPAPGSPPSP